MPSGQWTDQGQFVSPIQVALTEPDLQERTGRLDRQFIVFREDQAGKDRPSLSPAPANQSQCLGGRPAADRVGDGLAVHWSP